MHRLYFDTEFTGLHQNTTLISLGIVAETGEEFYAEFNDYDENQIDDWLRENVLSNRFPVENRDDLFVQNQDPLRFVHGSTAQVVSLLNDWLYDLSEAHNSPKLEFWSDCYAYDWVLFCQLWGHAFKVPDCVYYIPQDLCSHLRAAGYDPDVTREEFAHMTLGPIKHNALWDAKVIKGCFERLEEEKKNAS